jgi:hypothetical protein
MVVLHPLLHQLLKGQESVVVVRHPLLLISLLQHSITRRDVMEEEVDSDKETVPDPPLVPALEAKSGRSSTSINASKRSKVVEHKEDKEAADSDKEVTKKAKKSSSATLVKRTSTRNAKK